MGSDQQALHLEHDRALNDSDMYEIIQHCWMSIFKHSILILELRSHGEGLLGDEVTTRTDLLYPTVRLRTMA